MDANSLKPIVLDVGKKRPSPLGASPVIHGSQSSGTKRVRRP